MAVFKPAEWPTSSRPRAPSGRHTPALAPLVRLGWASKPPRRARALSIAHSPRSLPLIVAKPSAIDAMSFALTAPFLNCPCPYLCLAPLYHLNPVEPPFKPKVKAYGCFHHRDITGAPPCSWLAMARPLHFISRLPIIWSIVALGHCCSGHG